MILFGGFAVILIVLWLRMRFFRSQFNRALKAMDRGGFAQRASMAFWKVAGLCVLIAAIRLWLEMRAR